MANSNKGSAAAGHGHGHSAGPGPGAGSGIGGSSKLSLCLIHFVLAISSGLGLKHSIGRYAQAAFGIFFGHSLLCLLRHTHPNPGTVQRLICDKSRRYASVLFITLIIGELQHLNSRLQLGTIAGADWQWISVMLWSTTLTLAISNQCLGGRSALGAKIVQLDAANLGLCVVWNIYCLWHIAIVDEFWWSLGLALLVLMNHFVLWRLPLQFKITQLEVGTVGMCFSVIFAINAIQEQLDAS
ncbi:uncharacterized protein [Drosophila pseudoobscura]|uniref:Uncharacterized protein n=1 Tax=Drosophila pseudoobscura pseudoobscura TaxID=46245 RepID=A0A6I8UFH5_DROPS|nr:uncharacterized protein LOC4815175 [Drosophila pseudoobscura]